MEKHIREQDQDVWRQAGQLLRHARVARGMSRAALGQRAGVAWEVVMACETGRNRIRGWRQLTTALGLDLHALMRQAQARAWGGPQGTDRFLSGRMAPPDDPGEMTELASYVSELAKEPAGTATGD